MEVNLFASRVGGGVHAKAAGCRVAAPGGEAVLADLRPELRGAFGRPPPAGTPPRQ